MSAEDVVCDCLHVTASDVERACAAGARDADAVGRATGAMTGCGSCRGRLERMVTWWKWKRRLRWR